MDSEISPRPGPASQESDGAGWGQAREPQFIDPPRRQSGDRCPGPGRDGGGLAGAPRASAKMLLGPPAADILSGHLPPRCGQAPPPWSPHCHPMDVLTPHSALVTNPALVLSASAHVRSHWELSDVCCTHLRPAPLPAPCSHVPGPNTVPCLMPSTNLVWITTPALSPAPRYSHCHLPRHTWPSGLSLPPLCLPPPSHSAHSPGSHQNVCFRIMPCSSSHIFRASAVLPFPASTMPGGNSENRPPAEAWGPADPLATPGA